jgi:hypothetical protein
MLTLVNRPNRSAPSMLGARLACRCVTAKWPGRTCRALREIPHIGWRLTCIYFLYASLWSRLACAVTLKSLENIPCLVSFVPSSAR